MPTPTDLYSVNLEGIKSINDLCAEYHKIRPILEAVKGILQLVYPQGAAAISAIEAILDQTCPTLNLAASVSKPAVGK